MRLEKLRIFCKQHYKTKNRGIFVIYGNSTFEFAKTLLEIGKNNHRDNVKDCYFYKNINLQKQQVIQNYGGDFIKYDNYQSALGNTYRSVIFDDYQGITPNIMTAAADTVEENGFIIFLIEGIEHKKDISMIELDIHKKYSIYGSYQPIFFKRFFSKLINCKYCLFLRTSEKWLQSQAVLMFSKKIFSVVPAQKSPPINGMFRTEEQYETFSKISDIMKGSEYKVAITSDRGTGKSSLLGFLLGEAIFQKYIRIDVIVNQKTIPACIYERLSDFLISNGIKTKLKRNEVTIDYEGQRKIMFRSTFCSNDADLVIVDEAATFSVEIIKNVVQNSKRTILASTIGGYEGTGKAFRSKILEVYDFKFFNLKEKIRFVNDDPISLLLSSTFLNEDNYIINLEPAVKFIDVGMYKVDKVKLFRDERLLKEICSIYSERHYRNTPNDLLMLADAPNHHLYLLIDTKENNILSVAHVAIEGDITDMKNKDGNLISWTIYNNFGDKIFLTAKSLRILRIATNSRFKGYGYGRQLVELLTGGYNKTHKVKAENCCFRSPKVDDFKLLEYFGVSFGLNYNLLSFWISCGFAPVYLRNTLCDKTGDFSIIMLKKVQRSNFDVLSYFNYFRKRFFDSMKFVFGNLEINTCQKILRLGDKKDYRSLKLDSFDIKRLEIFVENDLFISDVIDILPSVAEIQMFSADYSLTVLEEAMLLMISIQGKSMKEIADLYDIEFNSMKIIIQKVIRKVLTYNLMQTVA